MKEKGLHPKNNFKNGYNFDELIIKNPELKQFVAKNEFGTVTIDFSNPEAVRELNKALICSLDKISNWNFPKENLCPPIPGRLDYIHYLADLISFNGEAKILDIGTGATCIYPLLGASVFDWSFVATDIDLDSLDVAQDIIDDNNLTEKIELRQQFKEENILIDDLAYNFLKSNSGVFHLINGSSNNHNNSNISKSIKVKEFAKYIPMNTSLVVQ